MGNYVVICRVEKIPPETAKTVNVEGNPIAVSIQTECFTLGGSVVGRSGTL